MPLPPATRVTSRQNSIVARFRDAARRHADARAPVLVEGATLLQEARSAGWTIDVAAFTEQALAQTDVARLFDDLGERVSRVIVPERILEAMSPARAPSGVVAIAQPHGWSLTEVLAAEPALVVVAVDVQDPGNVGAIVRAAEAAGATGVIASGATADPFGWKALRGAMGSVFRLPLVRVPDTRSALRACRERGLRILATALDGAPVDTVALDRPCAVCVGAEGAGLPAAILDAADARITIPMQAPVESLNVAVAAGIILYEARRQRTRAGDAK
jgi:RNA methyltransferase, TrmH family